MKKAELVGALSSYADRDTANPRAWKTLARFLAYYFNSLDLTPEQEWYFEGHIPQILVGAFDEFRTSQDTVVRQLRTRYEEDLGHPFADPTDIRGNGIDQALLVQGLCHLFRRVMGDDQLTSQIDVVFNAKRHLLLQVFYKFLDRVFRQGLFEIINSSAQSGMSGTFGSTTLRGYTSAGSLILTFSRPGETREHTVTFICGDDDPLGLGGGVQTVLTDLQTAIDMLSEVTNDWPQDRASRVGAFTEHDKVGFGL